MGLSNRVTELLEKWYNRIASLSTRDEQSATLGDNDGVVSVTTASTLIASANTDRLYISIKNDGNVQVAIKLGGEAELLSRNDILAIASGTRTGDGGVYDSKIWYGSIYGIVESGTADVTVTEIVSEL